MKNEAPDILGFDIPKLATQPTVREAQEHMAHHKVTEAFIDDFDTSTRMIISSSEPTKDTPATLKELAEQFNSTCVAHLYLARELERLGAELIALQKRRCEK